MKFVYFLAAILAVFFSINIANADDDMVLIPGGKFLFGEDKKKIEVGEFSIDKYETGFMICQEMYGNGLMHGIAKSNIGLREAVHILRVKI